MKSEIKKLYLKPEFLDSTIPRCWGKKTPNKSHPTLLQAEEKRARNPVPKCPSKLLEPAIGRSAGWSSLQGHFGTELRARFFCSLEYCVYKPSTELKVVPINRLIKMKWKNHIYVRCNQTLMLGCLTYIQRDYLWHLPPVACLKKGFFWR